MWLSALSAMFAGATNYNSELSKWNVGNVRDMSHMFYRAFNFKSELSKWDTGKVNVMGHMFYDATKFNSDMSKWNTGNVQTMSAMFAGAVKFNSDLSKWETGNVRDMTAMFQFWPDAAPSLSECIKKKMKVSGNFNDYAGLGFPTCMTDCWRWEKPENEEGSRYCSDGPSAKEVDPCLKSQCKEFGLTWNGEWEHCDGSWAGWWKWRKKGKCT